MEQVAVNGAVPETLEAVALWYSTWWVEGANGDLVLEEVRDLSDLLPLACPSKFAHEGVGRYS